MGADVVEDDTEHSQRTQAIYVGSVLEDAQKLLRLHSLIRAQNLCDHRLIHHGQTRAHG